MELWGDGEVIVFADRVVTFVLRQRLTAVLPSCAMGHEDSTAVLLSGQLPLGFRSRPGKAGSK